MLPIAFSMGAAAASLVVSLVLAEGVQYFINRRTHFRPPPDSYTLEQRQVELVNVRTNQEVR